MATRTKVRGNGKVNNDLTNFLQDLEKIRPQLSAFLGDNKTRTLRNMSGDVGGRVMAQIASVSSDLANLQQIACRAMVRSFNQDTSVGGSRTRRRKADGSISES